MKTFKGILYGIAIAIAVSAGAATVYNYFPPPGMTYSPTTGFVVGSATGGAKGAGTVNAQGVFVNGAAVVTGGVPVGANPTGTVGLTAVNGSATTFLRSDGAPALSQAISPTWTGQHLFTGGTNSQIVVGGVSAGIDAGGGSVLWTNSSAATDAHLWECSANSAAFTCRTLNDAFSASRNYMMVQRSALALTHMLFGNATDNNDFTFQGTGAVNINNELAQGDGTASYLRNATGTGGLFLGIGATNYWQVNHNGGLVNTTVPASGTALTVNQNAASATSLLVANAADNTSDIIFSGLTKGVRVGHSPTGSTVEGVDQTGVGSFQPLGVNGSTLSFGTGSSISSRVTISATGAVVVNAPASSGVGFTANGFANSYTALVQSSATSGQALGLNIQAGTTSADKALHISNAGNTLGLFDVFGDGGVVAGAATGGDQGAGTINMQGCFVNGVACSTGGAAGANPTGTVGLTAVNGVAGTYMRSDAAPPLSQAITPTWTGVHTFANTGTSIVINNSGGGVDAKNTRINYNGAGNFSVSSATDAAPTTAVTALLGTTRTGTAWTSLSFGSTTDNPTYSFLGTGQVVAAGNLIAKQATSSSYGIITAADTAAARILQMVSVGSTATPIYGVPAGGAGIDTIAGASLTLSTADTARVVIGTSGNITVNAPSSLTAFTVTGCASCNTALFQANTGAGTSFGPIVQAGTNSSDINFRFLNATGSTNYLEVFGDGGVIVGNPTGGDKGGGAINAQAVYVNGVATGAIVCTTACSASGLLVGQSVYTSKSGGSTSRASTTTDTIDPDLQFTSVPVGLYQINYTFEFGSAAGAGFKFQLVSSGADNYISGVAGCNTATAYFTPPGSDTQCSATNGGMVSGTGFVRVTSTGTVSINWAQISSNATPTVLFLESNMSLTRVN